ncbi:MAG: L,D-transpeptidase family protein [Bacillota bacterium]
MLFKITYAQIRIFVLTTLTLLAVWLFMGHYARFEIIDTGTGGKVMVNVSFLAPMNRGKAVQRLEITGEVPGRNVAYNTTWLSRNTVQIIIDESDFPRGLEYKIVFKKAPALIPPFTVSVQKNIRQSLPPEVIGLSPASNVPTTGPLVLILNTPVDPGSFEKHVNTDAPGKFTPQTITEEGKEPRYDYSRWVLSPLKRFKNSTSYRVIISPGLQGTGGGLAEKGAEIIFTTAPALEATEIYPRPFSPSIWLSRDITVTTNHALKEAKIMVNGINGNVSVKGNTAVFNPYDLFLPSKEYKVSLDLVSEYGERLKKEFTFGTTNLGNQRWIGIKAGNPCNLKIYEGNKPLKSFQGWLSLSNEAIPKVTMYEIKRGSTWEYYPEDPSPVKYLRLNADIMLHHMKAGEAHNHRLLGLPPSFGCILLNRDDMDWILNNVPEKCMVIVH